MDKKYIITLAIFCLCLFFTFSTVSAFDSVENQTVSVNVDNINTSNIIYDDLSDDDLLMQSNSNNEILGDDDGSFSSLYTNLEGKTEYTLTRDYTFDSSKDNGYVNGIPISSQLTINGAGHTINALNLARIFNIQSTVTLNNIIFANAL